MRKTKLKNGESQPLSFSFRTLWAGSYAVFWISMWALLEFREYRPYAFNMPAFVLVMTVITFLTSTFQERISESAFRHPMRGWVLSSMLGSFLSVLAFGSLPSADLLTSTLALLMPIALVQTVWLLKQVKSAWIWPLASLMTVPLFVFPFREYDALWESGILPFFVLIIGAIQGVIQAVVIRHLWIQSPDTEKAKQYLRTEDSDDHAAVQRLALSETSEEMIDDMRLVRRQSR